MQSKQEWEKLCAAKLKEISKISSREFYRFTPQQTEFQQTKVCLIQILYKQTEISKQTSKKTKARRSKGKGIIRKFLTKTSINTGMQNTGAQRKN